MAGWEKNLLFSAQYGKAVAENSILPDRGCRERGSFLSLGKRGERIGQHQSGKSLLIRKKRDHGSRQEKVAIVGSREKRVSSLYGRERQINPLKPVTIPLRTLGGEGSCSPIRRRLRDGEAKGREDL